MIVKNNQLIGLLVETRSGELLGRVSGFELDSQSHEIIRYQVKKSGIWPVLLSKYLLIHKNQVVSLTAEKMIVEDALVKDKKIAESTMPASG